MKDVYLFTSKLINNCEDPQEFVDSFIEILESTIPPENLCELKFYDGKNIIGYKCGSYDEPSGLCLMISVGGVDYMLVYDYANEQKLEKVAGLISEYLDLFEHEDYRLYAIIWRQ